MSLKLTLIFVSAIVCCLAISPDYDNLLDANPEKDQNELGETESDYLGLNEIDQTKYENDWKKSGKKYRVEKDENGAKYSKKYNEQENEKSWTKKIGDKKKTRHEVNTKLHKWGKDLGGVVIKEWNWEKEQGEKGEKGENDSQMEDNNQNTEEEDEEIKNNDEDKTKKRVLKQKYIIKQNKKQAKKRQEKKYWTEKKPYYNKYQNVLDEKARRQEYELIANAYDAANNGGYLIDDNFIGYY